eukprot:TRINITY_DN515_c0_g2_i2.p1 TRINITY_DN515_c0_g2~~TRINITY_DN515_c0_g2_i2.p1  ORF type:complete len:149 (+),score=30.41 TRINITY_DN515_c0_g2_i2:130-576(+)
MDMWLWYLLILVAVTIVKFAINTFSKKLEKSKSETERWKRVLIVTAHPDDESMFFIPLIRELVANNVKVHVLCLTNGNADGKGFLREQEQKNVSKLLKFSTKVFHDERFLDGMNEKWDNTVVADKISSVISDLKPTAVWRSLLIHLTF